MKFCPFLVAGREMVPEHHDPEQMLDATPDSLGIPGSAAQLHDQVIALVEVVAEQPPGLVEVLDEDVPVAVVVVVEAHHPAALAGVDEPQPSGRLRERAVPVRHEQACRAVLRCYDTTDRTDAQPSIAPGWDLT